MEDPSAQEPQSSGLSLRDRFHGWPTAVAIVIVATLVLITGFVLLWLVITTLGAFLKTVF